LELRNLRTWFHVEEGVARAVDGVSYTLYEGETLGVVGESGCGKSVTALSVMRLVPMPPGRHEGGQILFQGEDLCEKSDEEIRDLRGNEIAMIFQEPMTALNPVYTVGNQIMETVMLHQGLDAPAAREHAIEMLDRVGIPDPAARVDEYPHQLSGGMRQRVMIAIAMACDPALLIADEPTTALDVTIQAQILDLISELQESAQMSVLLITHDLGVVAQTAHHVAVMYAGKVVEYATVGDLFAAPKHPYAIGLFRSLPDLAPPGRRLATIPGMVPSATHFPSGCRFRTRCAIATERCAREEPALVPLAAGSSHTVACHHLEEAEKL
jgi:peptide/nickel transport system ATP-binding protein/oligopeptide transport system ATP-binding protein